MDLETMVRPVVEATGLELVDLTFRREGGRRILRVTIDKEGGLDLDTIAQTSERISRRLDLEGFAPGPYSLEVSSPGVERPLRAAKDFARHVGEKVKVRVGGEDPRTVTGTLTAAGDEAVTVRTDEGEQEIALAEVSSARTVFEWGGGR